MNIRTAVLKNVQNDTAFLWLCDDKNRVTIGREDYGEKRECDKNKYMD